MSPKRWILLLIFYISYLMFGASIYYHIEHGLERQRRADELKERIEINAYLLKQLTSKNVSDQEEILERISDYCGKPVTDYRSDDYELPYTWTFYHSFFFAFTVCSTVGYGNISPTTTLGQMIMIVYSIIGIPVNGILFAGLGEYFGLIFQSIYHRYKKYKMSTNIHYMPPQLSLITTVLIALIPGITMFLLIPSWVFSYFENWPFSLALYYAYVTTTTIGFGDYVPTFQPHQHRKFGAWFVVYQIFIIVWFIFSLGYLLMIMTFITRGLQSKKLAHLEQQLSSNIKATQHRIWSGVTKDVSYIRRIFNELYLMKYKPVYSEPLSAHCEHRSISCPDLTIYDREDQFKWKRKRAASECIECYARAEGTPFSFNSISDTELNKIDRQKSFETAEAFRQTTSLLFKVVDALAAVKPPLDDTVNIYGGTAGGGYHGFTDSQILASEQWSISSELPHVRERASSDFNIEPKWQKLYKYQTNNCNEWTWSGDNNQIQEAINKRYTQKQFHPTLPTLDSVINVENGVQQGVGVGEETLKKASSRKSFISQSFSKWIPFRKRLFTMPDNIVERQQSVISVPEEVAHPQESPLNHYSTVNTTASSSYFSNGIFSPPFTNTFLPIKQQMPLNYLHDSVKDVRNEPSVVNTLGPVYLKNSLNNNNTKLPIMTNQKRERRDSIISNVSQRRRNSIFGTKENASRRPSILSYTSQNDVDVLENTTLADLIRALEVMHTRAVMDDETNDNHLGEENTANKLKNTPSLTLLDGANEKTLAIAAANRLFARRSTVSGVVMPYSPQPPVTSNSTISNILTRRRRYTTMQTLQPPPYTLQDNNNHQLQNSMQQNRLSSTHSSLNTKLKRRFSVRATSLQIPPGQAPPSQLQQQQQQQQLDDIQTSLPTSAPAPVPAPIISHSQTLLQRRLSLRPSPLAQTDIANITIRKSGRYLSPHMMRSASGSGSSTSTHSPLSRIVQISQAQRKSSMPDGIATERISQK